MSTLRQSLAYEPRELKFGTSGRRGEVIDLTQLEVYLNALGELEFLQSLSADEGGIRRGDGFYLALDLRPTSPMLAQAVVRAAVDAGMRPVNLGRIPTPALTNYALAHGRGSIMVTGSHIPFDRNGYKTNTARGELLKHHEEPVSRAVAAVRARIYSQPFEDSAFAADGRLKQAPELAAGIDAGARTYVARYLDFFPGEPLRGVRLVAYQHSAVGRDLLVEILRGLGAAVVAAGRSDTFVPIDTENIDEEQLASIQRLLDETGPADAVVSTDGDSDRPLLLDAASGQARFFGGDLVGMVVAEYLAADAVVVPISCNDAIDRGTLASVLEPKTRIGSPYVIAGMEAARAKGRKVVCGWEANGGFLTGTPIERGGRVLSALPTRDAMLPIVCALARAREGGGSLADVFARLPQRFSKAALLKQFPRAKALRIVERCSAADAPAWLPQFFPGFGPIARLDYTDGVRIYFVNGEVAHLRPSGNADEFRVYAVADTQARADEIARMGVADPGGILRRLEAALGD